MVARNDNALPHGTILKNGGTEYRIEQYIGAGGFGITYLVSGTAKVSGNRVTARYCIKELFLSKDCERDHRTLAVTYSKPAKQRFEDSKKDFISEAKRLRDKIQHSHIVKVKDVFEAYDTAYYVMEFLEGKSLCDYIKKRGACSEDEATALILPIIRAIGYLHDQHITHLDIKPDNIMIVENERSLVSPILIDFGLSKHYDKKGKATSSIRVMATSDGYSPVEQYQGINTFQPTADIYALAATYLYCITGEEPKKSADIRPGEIKQLLQGKVSDSSLVALLNGMKPSQYERTQSVREFMSELCPNEDSENWDIESDNNITDPIFFRKRKKTTGFISKLKSLFSGKDKKIKLLDMPDSSICINLLYPEGEGFSKQVWFNFGICITVFTYAGDKQVYEENFSGGISDDVRTCLLESGLLEYNHWEKEQSQSDCEGNTTASITFYYSDGREYNRSVKNVNKSNRLFKTLLHLLNCSSIKDIVYSYEENLAYSEEEARPDATFRYENPDNEGKIIPMKYKIKVYSIWEFGQKKDSQGNPLQEDCTYPLPGDLKDSDRTFILCDGMGGHNVGYVASFTVCRAMSDSILNDGHNTEDIFTDEDLRNALEAAFKALDEKGNGSEKKMGTTMTFLKLHNEGATIAHMGDSRVYHIRPGKTGEETMIEFQTQDHSLAFDLVRIGEITPQEAQVSKYKTEIHRLMQPNMDYKPKPDINHIADIRAGDYFFMCSSGMLEAPNLDDEILRNIFSERGGSAEQKVDILKSVTWRNRDNHTAFIIHIEEVVGGRF